MKALRVSFLLLVMMTVVTGVIYPAIVTGIAQLAFPEKANGSLVVEEGKVLGSALIGQAFTSPGYFHPRPSAAGKGYDAASGSTSNLGPTSKTLVETVTSRTEALRKENPKDTVPVDLVTDSASGLDPHISPEAALFQAERVAKARKADKATIQALIKEYTEGRTLGIFGEPRVNVLLLNRALDKQFPLPAVKK